MTGISHVAGSPSRLRVVAASLLGSVLIALSLAGQTGEGAGDDELGGAHELVLPSATSPSVQSTTRIEAYAERVQVGLAKQPIGLRVPLEPWPEQARSLVERAEKRYREGAYVEASELFGRAVSVGPGLAWARYGLALTRTRLGEDDAATALLAELLLEDFPRFGLLLLTDPELSLFRETILGRALLQAATGLRQRWRIALQRGLRVILWQPASARRQDKQDEDPFLTPAPAMLRAGVYCPEAGRFISAGPLVEGAVAAWLWTGEGTVTIVRAKRYFGLSSMLGEVSLRNYDAVSGSPLDAAKGPPNGYEGPESVEIRQDSGVIQFRVTNPESANPDLPQTSGWRPLGPRIADARTCWMPTLRVVAEGTIWTGLPEGGDICHAAVGMASSGHQQREQLSERPDAQYRLVLPTAEVTWMASTRSTCSWNSGIEPVAALDYVVDRLAPDGRTRRFAEGQGAASALLVNNAALLLQLDERTYFLPGDAEELTQASVLPSGIVLGEPLAPRVCFNP